MPRTYITDLTHYDGVDDPELNVPAAARRIGRFFRAIAEQASTGSADTAVQTSVACRARRGRKRCPGRILARRADDPAFLLWWCPACGENGMISNWTGAAGDRSASPGVALSPSHSGPPGRRAAAGRNRPGDVAPGELALARVILRHLDEVMDGELAMDDAEYGTIVRAIVDGAAIHLRESRVPEEVARGAAADLLRHAQNLYVGRWLREAAEAGADAEEDWDEEAEKRLARQAFERATGGRRRKRPPSS